MADDEIRDLRPPKREPQSGGFLKRLLERLGTIWKMGDEPPKGQTRGPWVG
ncbi:uncharacterized protein METZ01_LOCUS86753 [marine metagenome]|uniref:Uncharacterized protein n=1 Tax=marine metagenome TaxID=408172 RepID=A0A381V0I4_9ZZZZ